MTIRYPVYEIVLDLSIGRVHTHIRVHDISSWKTARNMYYDKMFGRVSQARILLVLQEQGEVREELPEQFPLLRYHRGDGRPFYFHLELEDGRLRARTRSMSIV